MPDHRRAAGRRYPLPALLTIAVAAMLAERLSREERGDPGRAAPAQPRDQDGAIAVARYADHPVFGRLYWYYSSPHPTFADGHGESRDDFHL